ncbi:hypothetical protein BVRB_5g113220 [Beta vulgaris subsp. vulgaris]|nr:hypothetical protein BVRB_5g113220 [Beta vulgaris subsp. vulgaris]
MIQGFRSVRTQQHTSWISWKIQLEQYSFTAIALPIDEQYAFS